MIKVITRNNNTIEVTATRISSTRVEVSIEIWRDGDLIAADVDVLGTTRTLPEVIIYGLNKSLAILHDV